MTKKLLFGLLSLLLFLPIAPAFSYTSVGVSLNFHDSLAPYGTWVNVNSCGDCWRPNVGAGFVPFTNGYWAYTSYGPTWIGNEPWGWAAYHYGHWVFVAGSGWLWMPGYTWAAAPVEWAYGPDYIGWSPYLGAGPGDVNFWLFVHGGDFDRDNLSGVIIRGAPVRNILAGRDVRISRAPISRVQIQRITNRPVRMERVEQRTINVNGRRTRLVMPVNQRAQILREVNRAATARQTTTATNRAVERRAVGNRAAERRAAGNEVRTSNRAARHRTRTAERPATNNGHQNRVERQRTVSRHQSAAERKAAARHAKKRQKQEKKPQ